MQGDPKSNRRLRRVLIAEDHDGFRQLLAESFRARRFEVTECRHGLELVSHLQCLEDPQQPYTFDLIISDIRMPGVTGLSVLAGLREFKDVPPIILITAFGDEQTHAEAKRLGASAIIDKPFEIALLLSKAEEVLSL
jgi:DNA-binding response OmpR family regulator